MLQVSDTNVAELMNHLDQALPPSARGNRSGRISMEIHFAATDGTLYTLPRATETVWYRDHDAKKSRQRAYKLVTWFLSNEHLQFTVWSNGKVTKKPLNGLRSQHTSLRPKSLGAFG